MKRGYFWLTLRLMGRQRARTMTIFSGIFLASVLLTGFGGLGAGFWQEVHGGSDTGGSDAGAAYDSTQWILIGLVALLSAIVLVCAGMLLHNLMTLTFAQKWRSLQRLIHMGAPFRELTGMVVGEIALIFCVAAPSGWLGVMLVCRGLLGISMAMPWVLLVGIFLILLVISLLCGLWPLWRIYWKSKYKSRQRQCRGGKAMCVGGSGNRGICLGRPMLHRRQEHPIMYGRKRRQMLPRRQGRMRIQIIVCLLVSMVLYVPAGYVINKNVQMNREVLDQKFGIEYNAPLSDVEDFKTAMEECRRLQMANEGRDTMVYVNMPGQVSISSELLSAQLLAVLEDAGWAGERTWVGQGCLVFLEDGRYETYLDSCLAAGSGIDSGGHADAELRAAGGRNNADAQRSPENTGDAPAILVNRVVNRATYEGEEHGPYPETPLLNTDTCGGIEIYYGLDDGLTVTGRSIVPEIVASEPPADFDFDGDVTVILPMRSFTNVCQGFDGQWDVWACGYFADNCSAAALDNHEKGVAADPVALWSDDRTAADDAEGMTVNNALYSHMAHLLGDNAVGQLRNSRQAAWEWYASLKSIHSILNAICAVLFLIAIVNIFGTIFFQYMEQRHGLAIRWSVGATRGQLLWMLMGVWVRGLLAAIAVGIPLTGILCYAVYKVYRTVWHTAFSLPYVQFMEILGAAAVVMVLAFFVQYGLMRRQDFLQEIKRAG